MTEVLIHAPDTEPVPTAIPGKKPADSNWWKIGDVAVLLVYVCITTFTLQYHEKWADEAQAWLLARDLDLKTLWFHELRYEGSPGLWHTILWVAQHVFHASYSAIGYIGLAFAIAGVAVLIFKAPFPRIVRWSLAFTYVLIYQYAVIARSYNLLPLLAFLAAIFFRDREHPERITAVLIALSTLCIHGTVLAGCIGLLYLLESRKSWATFGWGLRMRYLVCAGLVAVTFLFLFFILKPTSDVEEIALKQGLVDLPQDVKAELDVPITRKLTAVVSGAFLDFLVPSIAFVALTAFWCFTRRKFLVFVLPVGLLIAFYGVVHGAAHHHGTVFVAAIIAIWIAWPTEKEESAFTTRERLALRAITGLLLCLCAINIWDAAVVIEREYKYPYSGAQDAASYIKSVHADHGPMFGLLFGVVGVQAFFDHNIFANMPTAYFHHGLPLDGTKLDLSELHRVNPEYIVAYSMEPELMERLGIPVVTREGYELVHFSDGYYLYKQSVFEREVYFIFRRTKP